MHFNYQKERDIIVAELEKDYPDLWKYENRFNTFVNVCIHPYKWEWVYSKVKSGYGITDKAYYALLGAMHATLVNIKKARKESTRMCNEAAPDIIEFIRNDSTDDPWRFLLAMRRYFPRYFIIRGLTTFGINWRDVAYDVMGAYRKPNPKTHHSLFTNLYVRTLCKSVAVFSWYRDTYEDDYEFGENDMVTLIDKQADSTKCKSREALEDTVIYLSEALPSWNHRARAQVGYYLNHLLPLYYLTEKQLFGRLHNNVIGTKDDYRG